MNIIKYLKMNIEQKIAVAGIALTLITKVSFSQISFKSDGKVTTTGSDTTKSLQSRSRKPYVYILPDGKNITEDKVDSVAKSWGGLIMNRDVSKSPVVVYLSPSTTALKNENENKAHQQYENLRAQLLGKPAPDFSIQDLSGKTWRISDLKGKTVVLNFYFTACVPCIKEIPELNDLVKSRKDKNIVFLAAALDKPSAVSAFLKVHKFDYISLPDAKAATDAYGVYAWPTHVVIDAKGIVRKLLVGNTMAGKELNSYLTGSR